MFHRIKSETVSTDKTSEEQKDIKATDEKETSNLSLESESEQSEFDMKPARKPVNVNKPTYSPQPANTQSSSAADSSRSASGSSPFASQKQSPVTPPTQKDTQSMTDKTSKATKVEDQNEKLYSASQSATSPAADANPYATARSKQTLARSGSGYPGSSYVPGGVASYKPGPSSIAKEGERRLTIGGGITMSGEIESCDYLLVEGTVEAALKGARILEIAESGTFYGTVEIQEAMIAGRFEGDITVYGRLTLAATAVITGSITYRELEVETGAVIDGRLTPVNAMEMSASGPQNAPSTMRVRAKDQGTAANETGLFEDESVTAAE